MALVHRVEVIKPTGSSNQEYGITLNILIRHMCQRMRDRPYKDSGTYYISEGFRNPTLRYAGISLLR